MRTTAFVLALALALVAVRASSHPDPDEFRLAKDYAMECIESYEVKGRYFSRREDRDVCGVDKSYAFDVLRQLLERGMAPAPVLIQVGVRCLEDVLLHRNDRDYWSRNDEKRYGHLTVGSIENKSDHCYVTVPGLSEEEGYYISILRLIWAFTGEQGVFGVRFIVSPDGKKIVRR